MSRRILSRSHQTDGCGQKPKSSFVKCGGETGVGWVRGRGEGGTAALSDVSAAQALQAPDEIYFSSALHSVCISGQTQGVYGEKKLSEKVGERGLPWRRKCRTAACDWLRIHGLHIT